MNEAQRDRIQRRDFLKSAGTLAALGLAGAASAADEPKGSAGELPAVALGTHRVSRLILGGNPIYGYSHFNRHYDQHLRDYHTPERVLELVRAASRAGIRTWQNSYHPRTISDVLRCREAGIEFNWLLLGKPDWDQKPEIIDEVAKHKPIGIAPHGALGERLHRAGSLDTLVGLLKRIRQSGSLVGLSAHNPALIELAEEKGWDVDYYMTCLYYLTRPQGELLKILPERPVGEIYLQSDRERMLKVIAAAKKPCLVYKVFAAGRLDLSPAGIRRTFDETLRAIKPSDAMIVGMFQEFGDQVAMNATLVRELCAAPARRA
jgi:hypothetical protein